jgi:hypothetical protein
MAACGLLACSSSPSAQARACTARAQLLASLDRLRSCQTEGKGAVCFDYGTGSASTLASNLDSARQGLVGLEAAVHLPQQTALQNLGGVGYLRFLEGEVRSLAGSIRASGNSRPPAQLSSFESIVKQRTTEMQQAAGAVTGC